MAREYDPLTKVYNEPFLDAHIAPGQFEGIYCYNVLHLFLQEERQRFVSRCAQVLSDGVMFFSVVSDQDAYYGQGKEVESNTFAVKPDKVLHFFTQDDLEEHFERYCVLETGSLEDRVIHTVYGPKAYQIRYIWASVG